MTDTDRPADGDENAARMELEPDALHEGDEGPYLDCPECGSPAFVSEVIRTGRCTGYEDEDVDEEAAEDVGNFCTAKLSLELVWADES